MHNPRKQEESNPSIHGTKKGALNHRYLLVVLLILILVLLLGLGLVILLESGSRDAVETQDGAVGVLDENVLLDGIGGLIGIKTTDTVNNGTDDTPTVAEVQVHLSSKLAGLVANNTENNVTSSGAGVGTRNETKLHAVSLSQDGLGGPASKLAGVVLHLSGDDGTTLGDELAAPVKSTTGTDSLAVELVKSLDDQLLISTASGALHDGVNLGTDDHLKRLLITLQGDIEAAVLVTLGGKGIGLLGLVVEGVGLSKGNLGLLGLGNSLQSKVVVDESGFHSQSSGGVDLVLLARGLGNLKRSILGVLVDADKIHGGTGALVEVDLATLVDNDDIPRVNTASGAHEHGEDVGGSENGGLVLLGEFVENGILGGSDVVGSTVQGLESGLVTLDRGAVVGSVVVVQETVRVEGLTLGSLEVQLGQTVEVNLLQHLPVGANVDGSLTVALRLVIILPAETTAAVAPATRAVVVEAVVTTASTGTLEATTSTTLTSHTTTLTTTTTENGTTTTTESALGRCASVVDNGERGLIFGSLNGEQAGGAGAVNLLVWNRRKKKKSVNCRYSLWKTKGREGDGV